MSDRIEKRLVKSLAFGAPKKDMSSRRFFGRGIYSIPGEFDTKVEAGLTKKLQKFDSLLRKFKYGEALNQALIGGNSVSLSCEH